MFGLKNISVLGQITSSPTCTKVNTTDSFYCRLTPFLSNVNLLFLSVTSLGILRGGFHKFYTILLTAAIAKLLLLLLLFRGHNLFQFHI